MSEPKLYTKNYITEECEFVVSHDDTFIDRLYDRDNDSQWVSDGANSNATEASIEITFKEGGQTVERDIDTVILINHNLEDPILEYWDGSAWQSLDSETNLVSGTYTLFSFNQVSTEKIRIRNSQTIVDNEEKEIGEMIACDTLFAPSRDLVKYDANFNARKASEITLGDGQVHRSVVMQSPNRSTKYECTVELQYLTAAEVEDLQAIKDGAQAFLWQPFSTIRPDQIFLVNWPGPFQHRYASSYTGAGFVVSMGLKEV